MVLKSLSNTVICMVEQFKNDKYSVNAVLEKLKMTVSMIIVKMYNDSIMMVLKWLKFNSGDIKVLKWLSYNEVLTFT